MPPHPSSPTRVIEEVVSRVLERHDRQGRSRNVTEIVSQTAERLVQEEIDGSKTIRRFVEFVRFVVGSWCVRSAL